MAIKGMYSLMFQKIVKWWLQVPLFYYLCGAMKKQKYFTTAVNDMTTDILNKRKLALATGEKNHNQETELLGIVDRFILSNELTDQEMKWEIFTLFTTSQEASAKIASAVLLFLAHLPEWQDKVYNEIVTVFGTEDIDVTEEDLKQLQNLDMVYKEVLRYLSIAALIQRRVEEEISIKNGTITLPVGTSLAIPIHTLHRDPRYWDEPNKVKPERFLPENCKNRDPNAFVPFSLGPMDCLGRVYATALIKTLIVKVLRTNEFEADGTLEELSIHVGISVKFSKGYNLRARPRKLVNGKTHKHY